MCLLLSGLKLPLNECNLTGLIYTQKIAGDYRARVKETLEKVINAKFL